MSEIDVSKSASYECIEREDKELINELKTKNIYLEETIDELDNRIQQLKAENETLNTLFKNYKKAYIDSTNKLGGMVIKNEDLYNEKEKYKNALDEIEKVCKNTELYEWCEYAYSCSDKLTEILQKIEEVKEDE